MDEMIKCNKCEISPKTEFYKNKKNKDGHLNACKKCSKYYKNYYLQQHKENINEYNKKHVTNRIKTDVIFRLMVYTRNRIYRSLKGMTKQSSTKEVLGIDIDIYRNWIEWQFTPEMNWSNTEVDHVKCICVFDKPDNEQLE